MTQISILGSTGSIGTQTLDIVRMHPELRVTALAAGHNINLIEKQIREFKPALAAVWEEKDAEDLRVRVADLGVKVMSGMDGLIAVSTKAQAQIVVTGIVGMIGIQPTIAAIKAGKDIALANKETLVCAGHIIMPLAEECGVRILPVDSEHSAIFQSLNGERRSDIEKILLTCSGGTFFGKKRADLEHITVEQALKNPNWVMGAKVTIDSASLVNKGLEVMEAKWLFGVDADNIQVLIHRQSVLHSAVQFRDGAVIGQMGTPDMHLPIQYALFYPGRQDLRAERLDLFKLGSLTFEKPDMDTFEGLKLAYDAIHAGGTMPTVFNAANEEAVRLFLAHKIYFLDIYDIIRGCMEHHITRQNPTVEEILGVQKEVREFVAGKWGSTE